MIEPSQNPPRNGEGDRAAQRRGGGAPPSVLRAPIQQVREARQQRRTMLPAEVILWLRRNATGFRLRRQNPPDGYKLDFCCLSSRVAVEVDGAFHDRGDQPARDEQRDEQIDRRGFATLRIPAQVIFRDLDSAVSAIVALCSDRAPSTGAQERAGPPPRSGED